MSQAKIQHKEIKFLHFDPDNPRLPATIRNEKEKEGYEELVIDWMLKYENVTELMGSIGEKGYFAAEPLLVVPHRSLDNDFEVVEGNRRLTAIKLLHFPEKATIRKNTVLTLAQEAQEKPEELPIIVFGDRSELLNYLGYKHITGVQNWDALAKAKYIRQLLSTLPDGNFQDQCKTLAKIIGSKSNYVRQLLIGVDLYETIEDQAFFGIPGLNEESFEFGVFYTALNRSNISRYVEIEIGSDEPLKSLNLEHLKDLTKWIFEKNSENQTRLGESRNLKYLNMILDPDFPDALKAFKNGEPLINSSHLTNHPDEIFVESVQKSLSNLEIARNYFQNIRTPSESTVDVLKEIMRLAKTLARNVEDLIFENEDKD